MPPPMLFMQPMPLMLPCRSYLTAMSHKSYELLGGDSAPGNRLE